MVYNCDICKREFNKHCHLISHKNKKIPCSVIDKTIENKKCIYCEKEFTRKTNLKKHIEMCKMNPDLIEKTTIINDNSNNNNNINGDHNTVNSNNIININFNIVNHGDEKYEKIDLSEVLDSGTIILKIIEQIHCNPKFPEYHNILITDRNRNIINVFEDDQWTLLNKNIIVQNLINRSYIHLDSIKGKLVKKYRDKVDGEISKYIHNSLDDYYLQHRRNLNNSISNIIYNNKNMIKETYEEHKKAKKCRAEETLKKKYFKTDSDSESD